MNILNWTIELIEPAHFVKVTAEGNFTLEDCLGMKEDFLSRDYWEPGMNVLIDYRQTAFVNIKLDALRAAGIFHEENNEQIGNGKMAFLMKSPHDFGLARQYEMITEGEVLSHVHVFLKEENALKWLAGTLFA